MTVKDFILEGVKKGTMHMTLLDPDKQSAAEAAEIAAQCKDPDCKYAHEPHNGPTACCYYAAILVF